MSNVMTFTGTVGKDAEVRYLPSGQAVLNVSVANNVGFGDRQQTLWFRVILWGKRAEGNLKDYLKKGQQVFVSGELTQSEYTGNDGVKKTTLELNANILDLVGKKNDTPQQSYGAQQATPASARQGYAAPVQGYTPPPFDGPYDDDIPF